MKRTYEKPLTTLYYIQPKGALLIGSGDAEKMSTVNGSWDEE